MNMAAFKEALYGHAVLKGLVGLVVTLLVPRSRLRRPELLRRSRAQTTRVPAATRCASLLTFSLASFPLSDGQHAAQLVLVCLCLRLSGTRKCAVVLGLLFSPLAML